MNLKINTIGLVAVAITALGFTTASACTVLDIVAKDGGVVVGGTMEFGLDVKPDAVIVPVGTELLGSLPKESNGIKYATKYGVVGLNFMGKHMLVDGMNAKGVYVGALYLPGYASYPKVKTYQDQSIRKIDVQKALDAAKGDVKVIKLHSDF